MKSFQNLAVGAAVALTSVLLPVTSQATPVPPPTLKLVEVSSTTLQASVDGVPWSSIGFGPILFGPETWLALSPVNLGPNAALWEEPESKDLVNIFFAVPADIGFFGVPIWAVISDYPRSDLASIEIPGIDLSTLPINANGSTVEFTSPDTGTYHVSFTDVQDVPDGASTFSLLLISGVVLAGANRFRSGRHGGA